MQPSHKRPCLGAFSLAVISVAGVLVVSPQAGAQQMTDRLGEALELVGFDRSDIGCTPKGYWSRFPNIDRIPQLLPFFKDLLAEPLHTYDFARVMAGALEEHLDPAQIDEVNIEAWLAEFYVEPVAPT